MEWPENVTKTLEALPDHPGVYIMRDADETVIYVGKAVNLKRRVRQYFQSSRNHGAKVKAMVSHVARVEYILAENELEALILECNLIKEYRPHYNILLKDDKQYPFLRIDTRDPFPRVTIARRMQKDGAKYFGPYIGAHALREMMTMLKKMFPLRTCRQSLSYPPEKKLRPCLNYQIGACPGPCAGLITPEEYEKTVREVLAFLSGKYDEVVDRLREQMNAASQNWQFEQAALYRDRLAMIDRVMQPQKAVRTDGGNESDVLALAEDGPNAVVQVTRLRDGRMIASDHYAVTVPLEAEAPEMLEAFFARYYADEDRPPKEILLPFPLPGQETLEKWLSEKRGNKVTIACPYRGEKRHLVELTQENAEDRLRRMLLREQNEKKRTQGAMEELQKILNLPTLPRRIEGYDNSNTQGGQPVSVMVVAQDGRAQPKSYRKFKVKTVEGPNDYETMREVLTRRFTNAFEELEERKQKGEPLDAPGKFLPLPDLVLIDGGKGQLGIALEVWAAMGLDIPVLGLAERFEEIYLPGKKDPLILPRNSAALQLLQRVRDEAHRFGITFHRSLRTKEQTKSELDDIPGIGPNRRRALLTHFKTVSLLAQAQVDRIAAVPGMNRPAAEAVYAHFHKNQPDGAADGQENAPSAANEKGEE